MSGHASNARPVCTWVPVRDASGRTHLEARWAATQGTRHSQAA